MSVALPEARVPEALRNPPRRHWTRQERERLEEMGLLEGNWELIEGELLRKMPKRRPHVQALAILTGWLISVFGQGQVNTEAPIDVSPEDSPTSEPEPDLIVLRRGYGDPFAAVPRAADVLVVVEVSDRTLEFDRTVKAGLYARAGLEEYWIVDVRGRRVLVHREAADGRWQSIVAYGEGESVSPLAAPEAELAVTRLFGRP
jgi:Uma2 family endonuclease